MSKLYQLVCAEKEGMEKQVIECVRRVLLTDMNGKTTAERSLSSRSFLVVSAKKKKKTYRILGL